MADQDIIEVRPYDLSWPSLYREEKDRLSSSLEGHFVRIDHIGSTSIPGLASKPIIDIMVSVGSFDIQTLKERLGPIGYVLDDSGEEGRIFFRKGAPRTHHVHVVIMGSWEYWKHRIFKEWMLNHPADLVAYSRLKMNLSAKFRDDRQGYCDAKAAFIDDVMRRASQSRINML